MCVRLTYYYYYYCAFTITPNFLSNIMCMHVCMYLVPNSFIFCSNTGRGGTGHLSELCCLEVFDGD